MIEPTKKIRPDRGGFFSLDIARTQKYNLWEKLYKSEMEGEVL